MFACACVPCDAESDDGDESDGGVCVVTRPALIHCCLIFVFLHLWECSDLCFLLNQKIAFHISLFGDTLGTVSSVHAHYGGVLA